MYGTRRHWANRPKATSDQKPAARHPCPIPTLVADQGGRIVGAAEVRLLAAPQAASMLRPMPTAGVELAVLHHNRSASVRELLTHAAEDWAGKHGARRIQLDVLARNRHALEWYRKRDGFEIAGVVLIKKLDSG